MEQKKVPPFNNRQTVDLSIGGLSGTVTIPVLLDDADFALYVQSINREESNKNEDEALLLQQVRSRYESTKHLVKDINFPGMTIDNFRPNGTRPYPALVFAIGDLLTEVIRDALNLPNS